MSPTREVGGTDRNTPQEYTCYKPKEVGPVDAPTDTPLTAQLCNQHDDNPELCAVQTHNGESVCLYIRRFAVSFCALVVTGPPGGKSDGNETAAESTASMTTTTTTTTQRETPNAATATGDVAPFGAATVVEVAGVPPCDPNNQWLSETLRRYPQCLSFFGGLGSNRSSVDHGSFVGVGSDADCGCLAQLSYDEVYHDSMRCTLPPSNTAVAVAVPARWLQCRSRSFCMDYAATCPGEEPYPGECDLAAWLAATDTSPGVWYSNGASRAEDTLTCRLVQLSRAVFSTRDRATSCHAASPSGGDICVGPMAAPAARQDAARNPDATLSFASPAGGEHGKSHTPKGSGVFSWTKMARVTKEKKQHKAGKGEGKSKEDKGKGKSKGKDKGKGKGHPHEIGASLGQLARGSTDSTLAASAPRVVLAAFISAVTIIVAAAMVRRRRSLLAKCTDADAPPDSPGRAALRPTFGRSRQKQHGQEAECQSCLRTDTANQELLEESGRPRLVSEESGRPGDGHRSMAQYLLNNDNGRFRPPILSFTA